MDVIPLFVMDAVAAAPTPGPPKVKLETLYKQNQGSVILLDQQNRDLIVPW